jgi:hypothetical protein
MKRLTIIFLAAVLLSLPAAAFAQDVGAAEKAAAAEALGLWE